MRKDVEVLAVADAAQLKARDAERRQRAQHLWSRRLPQLKEQTMLLRPRPHLWPITIPNCLFTLCRTEDAPAN